MSTSMILMRMRWASAVLLVSACTRDVPGTQPPHEGEPPVAATEPEAPTRVPEQLADTPSEPPTAGTTVDPATADPEPPPAPTGLSPPSEAEFRAWDRKDPVADAELDKWDREHLTATLLTYDELRCFHQTLLAAGERHVADRADETRWTVFKRDWVVTLDAWQKQYFADNPRVLERSKFPGRFLEAHELLMFTYVKAYDERDRAAIDKADAHWLVIEAKVRKRVATLGGELAASPTRCAPPAKR